MLLNCRKYLAQVAAAMLGAAAPMTCAHADPSTHTVIDPAQMQAVGTVSERFQSFNIDMTVLTGGRDWKPYGPDLTGALKKRLKSGNSAAAMPGVHPDMYVWRNGIELQSKPLVMLTAALGPAYLRISGAAANGTVLQNQNGALPNGYYNRLEPEQWLSTVRFANKVSAEIITSFPVSSGARKADGSLDLSQASRIVALTNQAGGRIAAVEAAYAPNVPALSRLQDYTASTFSRDVADISKFISANMPGTKLLGPGTLGDSADGQTLFTFSDSQTRSTLDLLSSTEQKFDAFSYSFYGATSRRCSETGVQTASRAALSREWLALTDDALRYQSQLRDRFQPGVPIWLVETGEAACGGNYWASSFLDTFRYVDQLGRLARQGVQVVAHNALARGDTALIDDVTLTPRPNYWAALLWRNLMGTVVLDPGVPVAPGLHVYAHCLRGHSGGVAAVMINTDKLLSYPVKMQTRFDQYSLAAEKLQSSEIKLNSAVLKLGEDNQLPELAGETHEPGLIELPPATITFVAIADAGNTACR